MAGWCAALAKAMGTVIVLAGSLATYVTLNFEPHRELHGMLPETLQPFRPLPIRVANAFHVFAKQTFGVELVTLDAGAMLVDACEQVSISTPCDYGEEEWGDFKRSFHIFIDSMKKEADLTLIGRIFVVNRCMMFLKQRLQLVHFWKSAPEDRRGQENQENERVVDGDFDTNAAAMLARAPVKSPLFVVGLPRTGTTFLHTLLAQDTEVFMSPLNWLVVDPSPPAHFGTIDEDIDAARGDRRVKIDQANWNLAQFKKIAKNIDAQHVMSAFNPEECIVFMGHTWVAFEFLAYMGNAKAYSDWLRDLGSYEDSFRWHRQILSHLGAAASRSDHVNEKRWVLKSPFHMGMLNDLVREYPDANIVMTHRRPVKSMTSLSSLQCKLSSVCSDNIRPKALAKQYMSLWSDFAKRAVNTRLSWDASGTDHPQHNALDVNLRDLHERPMSVVEQIYDRFGLALSASARKKMEAWLADGGSKDKHGKNVYKAEWFGLEDEGRVLQDYPGLRTYHEYFCSKFDCA